MSWGSPLIRTIGSVYKSWKSACEEAGVRLPGRSACSDPAPTAQACVDSRRGGTQTPASTCAGVLEYSEWRVHQSRGGSVDRSDESAG